MAGHKLPDSEINKRVEACYRLRYENSQPFKYKDWEKYCDDNYGDKSKMQYTQYWLKAKDRYTEDWKNRLERLLGPATDKIYELLTSEDPADNKEAVRMIFKYTGNDIKKVETDITSEGNPIQIKFGSLD
jgi:hypothetical protein